MQTTLCDVLENLHKYTSSNEQLSWPPDPLPFHLNSNHKPCCIASQQ